MKIIDVYDIIDKYAPFKLSDKLVELENMYDNSGVIIDHENDVKGITFALDFTPASVKAAIKSGSNLLITHHPAVYHPIRRIDGEYVNAIQNGLGVISAHLNLDCAKRGVDQCFAEALGASETEIMLKLGDGEGYGRSFETDATLGDFIAAAKIRLNTECFVYGEASRRIKKVASFCGAGLCEEYIDKVDADLYCSADVPHHVITYVLKKGKALASFTHYGSEYVGIINLYRHFCENERVCKEKIELNLFNDERLF